MINLKNFYKNKKVLITGHTGFKGAWLTQTLLELGSVISGISLNPKRDSLFNILNLKDKIEDHRVNILDYKRCNTIFSKFKPDIIFHLAAQPLVKLSYLKPIETHETNYLGTANILSLFSNYKFIKAGVFITTDKVYKNNDIGLPFKEEDPLGGYDPYSASKAASELLIESWRKSFIDINSKGLASARAGNVIGGGDWAENRIIPDFFRSYYNNKNLEIRNPNATRPWQHVLEPLYGYLLLAMKLFNTPVSFSEAWNFGPDKEDVYSVIDLIENIRKHVNLNSDLIKIIGSDFHESKFLSLDSSKSNLRLGWRPKLKSKDSIKLITDWYIEKNHLILASIAKNQIRNYFNL
jgi:CDP-glucose 4,6-dehydratase